MRVYIEKFTSVTYGTAHPIMSANLEASLKSFREPAEEFCRIVEAASEGAPLEFLMRLRPILPQLHLAALRLPRVDVDEWEGDPEIPHRSDKDWGLLYERLKKVLGQYDLYWTVFDARKYNEEAMHDSLADDLADIYYELTSPIKAASCGIPVGCVLWELRFSFYSHWGAHLVSAAKAMHDYLGEGEE